MIWVVHDALGKCVIDGFSRKIGLREQSLFHNFDPKMPEDFYTAAFHRYSTIVIYGADSKGQSILISC